MLLIISVTNVANAEYSQCICSKCHVESTVGRLVNGTCYFVPANFLSTVGDASFKHLKQYPLLRYSDSKSLSSSETEQLVDEITADLYIKYAIRFISAMFYESKLNCPVLHIERNITFQSCDKYRHAIFTSDDYLEISNTYIDSLKNSNNTLEPCYENGFRIFGEDRCFYFLDNGTCSNNDSVLYINSSNAWNSVQHFSVMHSNRTSSKTIFNLELKPTLLNVSPNDYLLFEYSDNTSPGCYRINVKTRRISRNRFGNKCNEFEAKLCQRMWKLVKTRRITIDSSDSTFLYLIFSILLFVTIISAICLEIFKSKLKCFTNRGHL